MKKETVRMLLVAVAVAVVTFPAGFLAGMWTGYVRWARYESILVIPDNYQPPRNNPPK